MDTTKDVHETNAKRKGSVTTSAATRVGSKIATNGTRLFVTYCRRHQDGQQWWWKKWNGYTKVGGPLGQTRGFSNVKKGGNIAGGIRIQVEELAALILEYLGQIHSTLRTNSLHLSDMIWMGEHCHQQHFVTLSYPNDEME